MENQAEKDLNIFHINMHTFPWKLTGNKKEFGICRPEDMPSHDKASYCFINTGKT